MGLPIRLALVNAGIHASNLNRQSFFCSVSRSQAMKVELVIFWSGIDGLQKPPFCHDIFPPTLTEKFPQGRSILSQEWKKSRDHFTNGYAVDVQADIHRGGDAATWRFDGNRDRAES